MSKLDELINQLCLDGVEYKTLEEIATKISSGGTPLTSKQEYYNGNIPWLRTQEVDWNDIVDTSVKISEEAVKNSSAKWIPANCVIVAMYGATAAKVAVNKIPLTTNQACCNIEVDPSKALYRYVYFWLCNNYEKLKSMGQGSQSNINAGIVKSFPIPLPPLPIQEEIVRILDNMTSLTAELTAELKARQKQYEYYRDSLLSFEGKGEHDGVRWMKLGEIAGITDYVANGSFASIRENVEYKREKDFAVLLRTVDFSNGFDESKFVYINEHAYNFLAKSKLYGGEIIINNIGAGVGTTFRCPKLHLPMSLAPNAVMLDTPNNDFYYHWLNSKHGKEALSKIIGKSAMPKFNKTGLRTITVPIPPLEEQQRIVDILDRFDKLCNDINEGLPAEIEARKKQYEYYRDKLLTFKEKGE